MPATVVHSMKAKITNAPASTRETPNMLRVGSASVIAFRTGGSERRMRMLAGRDFKNSLSCKKFVTVRPLPPLTLLKHVCFQQVTALTGPPCVASALLTLAPLLRSHGGYP